MANNKKAEGVLGIKIEDSETLATLIAKLGIATPIGQEINAFELDGTKTIGELRKKGEYSHYNDGSEEPGSEDYKMDALHFLALKVHKGTKDIGPHIAISVINKNIYVAINTFFKGARKTDDELKLAMQTAIASFSDTDVAESIEGGASEQAARTGRTDRIDDPRKDRIKEWVGKLKGYPIKIVTKDDITTSPLPEPKSMHGEMLIARYLLGNPKRNEKESSGTIKEGTQTIFENRHKHSDDTKLRAIRIGGTLIDCYDCYVKHHGGPLATEHVGGVPSKMTNTVRGTTTDVSDVGPSHDTSFATVPYKSKVMSSSTHGIAFPNWTYDDKTNTWVRLKR